MLIGEPQRTQADLMFRLFGFRVRVSPFFWLAGAVLGWNAAKTPTGEIDGKLLLIWIAVVFVSILLHELGHAIAFRYYGTSAYIVLYHFGGLAVPDSFRSSWGEKPSRSSLNQLIISAAGPVSQLILFGLIIGGLYAASHRIDFYLPVVSKWVVFGRGDPIQNELLERAIVFLLYVNLLWAVLNLLPVYPLDGGQITRELFLMLRVPDAIRNSLILSILAAAGIAVYALVNKDGFLALMFGMLAYSSYMALNAQSGSGGFGGRRPW